MEIDTNPTPQIFCCQHYPDTNNVVAETITITYTAVVLNTAGNHTATALNNSAQFTWTGNSLLPTLAANITVVEPAVDVTKSVVVSGAGTQGDAGDPVVYTINQAVVRNNALNNNGELKTNTVTVSATNLPNAVDTQNVTIVEPVLTVDKTVNDGTAHLGDTLTFQVTVRHDVSSTTDAMDVRLTDALTAGLTLVPGSIVVAGGGSFTNATSGNTLDLQWNQVNLADVITITYQATVTSDISQFATSRTNTAQVVYDTQPGSNPEERPYTEQDDQITTIVGPDVSVVKNDGQQDRVPGDAYTYTLIVTNRNDLLFGDVATNVVVVDTLPLGIDYVSASGLYFQSFDPVTREVRWLIPTLAVGASEVFTVNVQVNDPLASGIELVTNTVVAMHEDVDPTPTDNTDIDTDRLVAVPDLYVTKDDGIVLGHAGELITYTIVVGNSGNQNAVNVTVFDTLPTYVLNFISADNGGVFDPVTGRITWSFAQMVGHSTPLVLTVTAQVKAFTPPGVEFTNLVTIDDGGVNGPDPTPGNNAASDRDDLFARPDLVVTKTDYRDRISPRDVVTYEIAVRNQGTQTATNVVISDTLPPGVAFVSASDGGVYDPATHTVTWSGITALGQETVTRTITVLGTLDLRPLEDVVNSVMAYDDGANGPDPTPENNVATDIDEAFVYTYDSFNDPLIIFPGSFSDTSGVSSGPHDSGLSYEKINNPRFHLKTLPVDPMFSGTVDPGTTLVGKIYDASGRVIGERTVVADAGGSWLLTFPTAVIHKHPHRMTLEQTPAATVSPAEGFNLRRYFHPAVHGSLFVSEQVTVSNVFRNLPHTVLKSMHQANLNPLDLRSDHLRSYESYSSSTSPAQG
jgi:uncharacterized repeat protein (TIGR01451 family)